MNQIFKSCFGCFVMWCSALFFHHIFWHLLSQSLWLDKHQALDLESQHWSSEVDVSDRPSKKVIPRRLSKPFWIGGTNNMAIKTPQDDHLDDSYPSLELWWRKIIYAKKGEANLQTKTLRELLFRLWIAIGLADRPKDKVDTLPGFNVVSTSKKRMWVTFNKMSNAGSIGFPR